MQAAMALAFEVPNTMRIELTAFRYVMPYSFVEVYNLTHRPISTKVHPDSKGF
jgi:hypothetical protein